MQAYNSRFSIFCMQTLRVGSTYLTHSQCLYDACQGSCAAVGLECGQSWDRFSYLTPSSVIKVNPFMSLQYPRVAVNICDRDGYWRLSRVQEKIGNCEYCQIARNPIISLCLGVEGHDWLMLKQLNLILNTLQGVVTYMSRVEAFATRFKFKIESSDQNPFWEPFKGLRSPMNCENQIKNAVIWPLTCDQAL